MALGALDIEVDVDAASAIRGFNDAARASERFGSDATKGFENANRAASRFGKTVDGMSKGWVRDSRAMQGATSNLAAQFQDVIVSAQGGANAMTIALQQGTQIAAVMGTAGGGVRALGAAFMSLVNPVSLLTIGLVAGAAQLVQWATAAGKVEEVDLATVLKNAAAALDDLNKAFPQVNAQVKELTHVTQQAARGHALQEQAAAAAKLAVQYEELKRTFIGFAPPDWWARPDNAPILDAFGQFIEQVRTGKADVESFRDAIDRMQGAPGVTSDMLALGQALADFADDTLSARGGANELSAAVLEFGIAMSQGRGDIVAFTDKLAAIAATSADSKVQELAAQLLNALQQARELAQTSGALATGLEQAGGAAGGAAGQFLSLADASRQAAAAAGEYLGAMGRLAAASAPVRNEFQKISDDYKTAISNSQSLIERMAAEKKMREALANLPAFGPTSDDSLRLKREWEANQARLSSTGGGTSPMQKARDDLQRYADQLERTVDPWIIVNEEMAKFQQASAAGMIQGVTSAQAYEQAMIKAGLATKKAATEAVTWQQSFSQMMTQWGNSVASTLADAIVNGEDLGQVFQDLIKQLAKMALEMLVLKPLMESLTSGFGSMFGVAGASAPAPLPQDARAGLHGGTRNGTAGTVNNTKFGGLVINIGGTDKPGVAVSGANQRQAEQMGKRIRAVVERELVRQQMPGGILWAGGKPGMAR